MTATFAYRLLTWIRANKKELYSRRSAAGFDVQQHQAYDSLIERLASFDRYYRGAQQWLRNPNDPKNPPAEHFVSDAAYAAQSIVRQFMEIKTQLNDPVWHDFKALEGMSYSETCALAARFVRGRLPALVAKYPGAAGEFDRNALSLQLTKGLAVERFNQSHLFVAQEGPLGEQMKQIKAFWRQVRDAALEVLSTAANWPSEEASEQANLDKVKKIMERMMREASREDQAFLRQHAQAAKDQFARLLR